MEFDNPFEHKNLKAGSLGGRGCGSYGLRILPGGEERGRVSREESGKGGSLGGAPVVVTVCIR
jgi:hypothetical protein